LDKIIHIAADRTTLKTLTRISFLLQITRWWCTCSNGYLVYVSKL
jgi:hypothetical protein